MTLPTEFSGTSSDLLVGEITAVRTFDVDEDGRLMPISVRCDVWVDGENTATCLSDDHRPGDLGCRCGFYAFHGLEHTDWYWQSKNVLAVVACYGQVTTGSKGLRAQHARIEALWLSRRVPQQMVDKIQARYPGTCIYRNRDSMLKAHPLTGPVPDPEAKAARRRTPWGQRMWQGMLTVWTWSVVTLLIGTIPRGDASGVVVAGISAAVTAGLLIGARLLPVSSRRWLMTHWVELLLVAQGLWGVIGYWTDALPLALAAIYVVCTGFATGLVYLSWRRNAAPLRVFPRTVYLGALLGADTEGPALSRGTVEAGDYVDVDLTGSHRLGLAGVAMGDFARVVTPPVGGPVIPMDAVSVTDLTPSRGEHYPAVVLYVVEGQVGAWLRLLHHRHARVRRPANAPTLSVDEVRKAVGDMGGALPSGERS